MRVYLICCNGIVDRVFIDRESEAREFLAIVREKGEKAATEDSPAPRWSIRTLDATLIKTE